jgi:hypothetical protein
LHLLLLLLLNLASQLGCCGCCYGCCWWCQDLQDLLQDSVLQQETVKPGQIVWLGDGQGLLPVCAKPCWCVCDLLLPLLIPQPLMLRVMQQQQQQQEVQSAPLAREILLLLAAALPWLLLPLLREKDFSGGPAGTAAQGGCTGAAVAAGLLNPDLALAGPAASAAAAAAVPLVATAVVAAAAAAFAAGGCLKRYQHGSCSSKSTPSSSLPSLALEHLMTVADLAGSTHGGQ